MTTLNYLQIQTPPDVWAELLKLNPIDANEIFYEPFRGEGSLFNQVDCSVKFWSEIEDDRDVFDFEYPNEVTCIYSNPPFKTNIPNKKGEKVYKNAVFFFLDYFTTMYPNLNTLGFLINANSFNALTPYRLTKLAKQGFTISAITFLNTNYWYGSYYFVVFKKNNNELAKINIIEKTITKNDFNISC
jgi:hypothetical protein